FSHFHRPFSIQRTFLIHVHYVFNCLLKNINCHPGTLHLPTSISIPANPDTSRERIERRERRMFFDPRFSAYAYVGERRGRDDGKEKKGTNCFAEIGRIHLHKYPITTVAAIACKYEHLGSKSCKGGGLMAGKGNNCDSASLLCYEEGMQHPSLMIVDPTKNDVVCTSSVGSQPIWARIKAMPLQLAKKLVIKLPNQIAFEVDQVVVGAFMSFYPEFRFAA
ncbi:hypothetical protein M8C21_021529, partial [Ambrosia artemisiifolia]